MVRCHKCGYSNLHNAKHCIKCRTNLVEKEAAVAPEVTDHNHPNHPNRKTVVMAGSDETPWDQQRIVPSKPQNRPVASFQTVRRIVPDPNTCCLVAISLDEEKELRKIDLRSDFVSLNRALLDPANNSISRGGHANIYQKDGSWYLENTTALKTTFIQVKHPVKLSDGDVILMGDSLFQFRMGKMEKLGNVGE